MKRKTAELRGLSLRWAVASVTQSEMPSPAQFKFWGSFNPDINWLHGGPLIEKFKVALFWHDKYNHGHGMFEADCSDNFVYAGADDAIGETALVAICRAIVMAKLGDEVEIPDELCETKP
jgi:hypothetical protein